MKRIIIIGAFDRYNYGDNLMPILFEKFLEKNYPEVLLNHELVYSALTDSDLTRYKAKKTISINKAFRKKLGMPHAVISIGGEILCASSSTLFLHMENSKNIKFIVVILRKFKMILFADLLCRCLYRLPWEYPYIPKKNAASIVAFNTIGGGVADFSFGTYFNNVKSRLSNASYLSVRDTRVVDSINSFCSPKLFPDSVITISDIITDDFLKQECSNNIKSIVNKDYICFQLAPKKSDASAKEWTRILTEVSDKYNLKVVLCPIGYANGHDDIDILKEIKKESSGDFELLHDLNLWEILFVIKNSKIFLGTSLHGVITALSFTVPYIALNPKVNKLNAFVKDWGIHPSTRCYSSKEILQVFDSILNIDKDNFYKHSAKLKELGMENYSKLVDSLDIRY